MIKKITYAITAIALILQFGSCDKIEEDDFLQIADTTTIVENDNFIKKIIIEDFTGHKCSNCPEAAEELHTIQNIYEGKIIGIGVHAGFFAIPSTSYPADYNTNEGTEISSFFNVQENPIGMVNRVEGLLSVPNWLEKVDEQLALEPSIGILLSESNNTITVEAKTLQTINDDLSLVVCVTESGIISKQAIPGGAIDDYEHNHVLRKHLNGTWGDVVPLNSQELQTFTFNLSLDQDWVRENCHVIAYVYNNSSMEILQAEEIHLN
jgi:hypothetical protein